MELVELGTVLLQFFLTIGIMAIGFAWMLRGPTGARAVARWFFLRPIVHLLKWSWEFNKKIMKWMLGRPWK